jgi:hypothetical protein
MSALDGEPPQPQAVQPPPQPAQPPPAPQVIATPPQPPARGVVVDAVLKLSIAVAFLIAGVSIGYYFLVYVPAKDARTQAAASAAAANATAQAAASQQVAARRAANYNSCLASVDTTYHADWNSNCATRSQQREADYNRCLGGFLSESDCRDQNPFIPPTDCQLPTTVADSVNAELKDGKDRCLQQAKDGLLDQ